MSRHKARGLWEQIWQWPNLEQALSKTLRGKRERAGTRAFLKGMPGTLNAVGERLRSLTGPLGVFQDFTIFDPKKRVISAPCFADRVFHHAIFNICEPVFERRLIADTYACRIGKGVHAAVTRACHYAGRHQWYLKLDVRHFFETIPRSVLLAEIDRLFGEPEMIQIFSLLLESWKPGAATGLPIGALFSQHLGNFFLGRVDRLAKEKLRAPGYVRYMDDMVLWSDSRAEVGDWSRQICVFVVETMGQHLKPAVINRTAGGMDFLGRRIHPGWAGMNRASRTRWRQKAHALDAEWLAGGDELALQQRATALTASAAHSCCAGFRRRVLSGGHGPEERIV